SIDGNNGADHDFGARDLVARGAEPALHGIVHTEHLADSCSCTRADIAFARWFRLGCLAGKIAVFLPGADRKIANTKVHKDCRRYNRNNALADLETEIVLFEISHHPGGGCQTIGAAAGL